MQERQDLTLDRVAKCPVPARTQLCVGLPWFMTALPMGRSNLDRNTTQPTQ